MHENLHEKTIGVDFKHKTFEIDRHNTKVCLHFYDTSGDPQYTDVTSSYFINVQAFLICYDMTDLSSFTNCQYWLDEINNRLLNHYSTVDANNNKKLLTILVGCKSDLATQKKIPHKMAYKYARTNGYALFYETSSKDASNQNDLWSNLCMELISNYINYLKYQKYLFDLISLDSSPCTQLSVLKDSMCIDALTTITQVHFRCAKENLNIQQILTNVANSKRKNLQTKRFFDFYF